MNIVFKELDRSDAPAIARLQFESWSRSYTDVLTADYINGAMKADIDQVWSSWRDDKIVVGAVADDGCLAGFATYLMDTTTYIDNFHVDHAHHGRGVASTLFVEGAKTAAAKGATQLWLTVLECNARARAFYAKMGGKERAAKDDNMLGTPVRAVPVHWPDLHGVQKIIPQV